MSSRKAAANGGGMDSKYDKSNPTASAAFFYPASNQPSQSYHPAAASATATASAAAAAGDGSASDASSVPPIIADEGTGTGLAEDKWTVDPSVADGFRVVYDRELSLEVRTHAPVNAAAAAANIKPQSDGGASASTTAATPAKPSAGGGGGGFASSTVPDSTLNTVPSSGGGTGAGVLVAMKVKVLTLGGSGSGGADDVPDAVRIEFTTEEDLFFHWYHTLDLTGYRDMAARQKLKISFSEYPNMLTALFNRMIKSPHDHMGILYVYPNGTARLDFIHNTSFKFVELLSIYAIQSPPDVVRQSIHWRYFHLRRSVGRLQSRLDEVSAAVKAKNPSLLLQIKRTPLSSSFASAPPATPAPAAAPASASAAHTFVATAPAPATAGAGKSNAAAFTSPAPTSGKVKPKSSRH